MRFYRRFSTVGQMSAALCAFSVLALLLESVGLLDWAQRLELGPERSIALPAATALHRCLEPLGIERERHRGLVALARSGWSDDPLLLAEARTSVAAAVQPPVVTKADVVLPSGTKSLPAAPIAPKVALLPIAGDPPLLTELPAIDPVEAGKMRTVALAGDSMMAVGLSSTLLREAPKYKDLTLVKTFKSGTGLARPEVFNWQTEYPAMLGQAKPDIVVVAIGANDGQGFVEGKTTYAFGSDGWQKIYQQRVAAFLAMLEANGATVVWIELPPMKSDVLSERIALINRIDYAVVRSSPQAIWFSIAGLVGDAKGQFQDFGQVQGATVRLRQSDGIHLSDEGAVLLSSQLLPWLGKQAPENPR